MLFLLISILPFFLLLSKSLPLQPLPSWAGASEVRLLPVLFWQELLCFVLHSVKNFRELSSRILRISLMKMSSKRKCASGVENVVESVEVSVLDLPDLALECILAKLPPAELCNMASVCSSLRDLCRSDYMWERHMREKWGRVIGQAARREWECYLASRRSSSGAGAGDSKGKRKRWMGSLSCVWPLSWIKSRIDSCSRLRCSLPDDSIVSWYLALESGKFWFPAQVYNREVLTCKALFNGEAFAFYNINACTYMYLISSEI